MNPSSLEVNFERDKGTAKFSTSVLNFKFKLQSRLNAAFLGVTYAGQFTPLSQMICITNSTSNLE